MQHAEDYLIVSGREVRVLHGGAGPPLVLVHGIGVSADWWLPTLSAFASKFTVYAMDLPGHGASDAISDDDLYAPELFLADLLTELDIKSAAIVGHSMGGYVAGRFALYRPMCVNRLILVDSAGFGNVRHSLLRAISAPVVGELSLSTPDNADYFVATFFYDASKVPEDLYNAARKYARRPEFASSFLRLLRSGIAITGRWKRDLLSTQLERYKGPLLVVWGAEDPVFPVQQVEGIRRHLPHAQVCIFQRCGHMPQIEYPHEFANVVLSFLEES